MIAILSIGLALCVLVIGIQRSRVFQLQRILDGYRRQIERARSSEENWQRTVRELLGQVTAKESTAEIVKEMGEALAKSLVGWGQPANNANDKIDAMSMGAMGYDGMGGVKAGDWYPEVEFDDNMEDATRWPTRGGWVGKQDSQTQEPATEPSPNGETIFRSGQSGPSPTERIE